MSVSTHTKQSDAQVNVHDQYPVIVHSSQLKQDITVTDNGSFKNASVKKKTFSSSTDTACISYNLRPRTNNREFSRPFLSSHENRNTCTLSWRPVQYFDNSEVLGVKQKFANPNDNISIELPSVEAKTAGVDASCRSYNFQSGCDMNALACNLAAVEYFESSEIVGVKQEMLDCVESHDFEGPKEEMLSVSNVSCVSYGSGNNHSISSEPVCSRHREDTKISDASKTCKSNTVDSVVRKQPSTCKIISSRSCGLHSRNWYHDVRNDYIDLKIKGNSGNDKNYKNRKYCEKISRYNLRPRNTQTGKFTPTEEETCLSNSSSTRHCAQVKQALKNGDNDVENLTSVPMVGISCGACDLQPRNSQGGGSACGVLRRICSSGLSGQCKSANIDGDLVKPTSVCEADIVSGPNSSCGEIGLHNLRPSGVQVKQGNGTQVKREIRISSADVSSETYNLRPRNKQGRYSNPLSLQHSQDIVTCLSGFGYSHKLISAEDVKQETPLCDVDSVSSNCTVCSGIHNPNLDNVCVNLEVKEEETDNEKNNALKCSRGESVCNIQHHCRSYLYKHSESNAFRNNHIKSKVVTDEDIALRMPSAFSQLHGQRWNVDNNADVGSSMLMVTDVMSCEKNIVYYLRSRCIVKEILDQDLPFRKEIKKEAGIQTESAVVEIPKPLISYTDNEAIPIDSFENMNTRHCEQDAVGNKGNGSCGIDNSVAVTEVHNLSAGVGSSMHMVTDVTLSERNIPYCLQSHCNVKDILDQDFHFRQEIKKEGIQTKTVLVGIRKTCLSGDGEAIPVDSFKNLSSRHSEKHTVGNRENSPCTIYNPVTVKEIQNFEDVPVMNDHESDCSKESFWEESKQETTGSCVGRITSLQEGRSVSHSNENNFGGATCLQSGRQLATAVEKNTGNENHCVSYNITYKQQFLQNCQSHTSYIGQNELQVFGDEKGGEGMECLESNTVEPCPGSDLQLCEKSNICTEEIFYEMASACGHRGSDNHGLSVNEDIQIHDVERSGTYGDVICDQASKIGSQVYNPVNAAGTLHTKGGKLDEEHDFGRELLQDLSCNENRSETLGTLQDTKVFPHNKTVFVQNESSIWQQEIKRCDSGIHNEQGLIPASNADMIKDEKLLHRDKSNGIREWKLGCIDNTGLANQEDSVGDITYKLSFCSLTKELPDTESEYKGSGLIHGTDDSLRGVDFDVNGPNTIEISMPRKSGSDSEKLNLSIPHEVILPGIDVALTAEDFNVDGPNTVKISAPRDSLFTAGDRDRMHLDNDLQDGDDSDIDKMEFCVSVQVPKLSLGDNAVPELVMQGMCKSTMQFLVVVVFFMLYGKKCLLILPH
jgi:hypothetical protein